MFLWGLKSQREIIVTTQILPAEQTGGWLSPGESRKTQWPWDDHCNPQVSQEKRIEPNELYPAPGPRIKTPGSWGKLIAILFLGLSGITKMCRVFLAGE